MAISLFAQPGWGPDRRLVYLPGGGHNPRAGAWVDMIHLVWYQSYPVYDEIFYKRSTDAGMTWSGDVLLSVEDNIQSIMPDVAVKGDTVIVVWSEYQSDGVVQYRRSEDGGNTFNPIDSIKGPGVGYPSVAMVEDTVYMIIHSYSAGGNPGVYYTSSTDGGVTWDSLRLIYNDTIFQQPRIALTWPNLHVVFSAPDTVTGQTEIFYLSSNDGGQSWSNTSVISHNDDIASQIPFNTSWPGGTGASWFDYKYSPYPWTGDIFFRRRNKFGGWVEIDSLTTEHRAVWSDILAERTHLHIVWEDDRNQHGINNEIYYRESPDLGISWFREFRLTSARYHSYTPSLACGGSYLHLFWRDCRDSLPQIGAIYYKRKDLSVTTPEGYNEGVFKAITISPNPFKERILISFSLSDALDFIEIFDEAGRRVFRQQFSSKGRHDIIWKAERAGIYFIRLETKDRVTIEKVVALK